MFSKLIATASIAALGVASLAAPALAETAAPSNTPPTHQTLPTPSAQAKADGVQPGNAPMNWQRAGSAGGSGLPASALARTSAAAAASTSTQLAGVDMASYAGAPSAATWKTYASEYGFVFIKATEGNYYNPSSSGAEFNSQYAGATAAGMVRGAYHFANPHSSGGGAQADYFVNHGGGWSPDGKTLPGVLDIEYNPYTSTNGLNTCYGLTKAQMVTWIRNFSNEYLVRTGVYPTIYTTVGWWKECTGNTSAFAATNPFWVADPNTGSTTGGPGSVPAGTSTWTYWQYGQDGQLDWDKFNGGMTQLKRIATSYAYPIGSHVARAWVASLGHPISAEKAVVAWGMTGYVQQFPKGKAIVSSPYGTFVVGSPVLSSWAPTTWGWPTSPMRTVTAWGRTGYAQNFGQKNRAKVRAIWSTLSGSTVWMSGSVLTRYDRLRGISGVGWPRAQATVRTVFGVAGTIQPLQSGKALVSSPYGTYFTAGAIRRTWLPGKYGWPMTDLKAATLHGHPVWLERFRMGTKGVDYAYNPQKTSTVTWVNGRP